MSVPINQGEKIPNVRGRVYRCLVCGYMAGKGRVVSHWYKTHRHYTEAPFYCTVCLFRATKEKELVEHIKTGVYPPHQRCVDHRLQRNQPVDFNNMLMRSSSPKFPVEGVDIECMTTEDSSSFWDQRRRPTSADPQGPVAINILPQLLDYDPNERITPAPVPQRPKDITMRNLTYSPEMPQGPVHVYHPTPLSLVGPGRHQPDLLQRAMQATQINEDDVALVSRMLPDSLLESTLVTIGGTASPDPNQLNTPPPQRIVTVSSPPAQVAPTVLVTSSQQVFQDNPNVSTPPPRIVAPPVVVGVQPVQGGDQPVQGGVQPVQGGAQPVQGGAQPVQGLDGAAGNQDNAGQDQVARAIREMSHSLVEAIANQSFQIEMVKNTLSAFLRRMDDRDKERHPVIPQQYPRRPLFPPKRRSVTPIPASPARKKKRASSTAANPEKKK